MSNQPIGVFDSGIGGLTVLKSLLQVLPNERFIYVGDTARVPYGSKSATTVQQFSLQIGSWLFEQKVKAIVVACNTASAFALPLLNEFLPIPVFGVIQPGSISAVSHSKGSIGIIATRGTIESQAYEISIRRINPSASIYSTPAPLLVPFVEEGEIEGDLIELLLRRYLQPLMDHHCDTLLLGCTHYPLLKSLIRKLWNDVVIVDSADSTAELVRQELQIRNLIATESIFKKDKENFEIYLTDVLGRFIEVASFFLSKSLTNFELLPIETLEHSYLKLVHHAST